MSLSAKANVTVPSFTTVTEYPGVGASEEQLDMLRTRYELARVLCEGKEGLEIACGTGTGLGYIARTARSLAANDIDLDNIARAKAHYKGRFEIQQMDAQALDYPDASFDAAFLLETIYYLPDAQQAAREAYRVLRPGGTFLIVSANREWTMFNPSPFTHQYYSATEISALLNNAGFDTVETKVGFPDCSDVGIVRKLRKFALKYNLIPKTMWAKEKIKLLLYGNLEPIPAEASETTGQTHLLLDIK